MQTIQGIRCASLLLGTGLYSFDDMVRTLMVADLHLDHDDAVAAVRAAQEVESRTNLVSE